MKIIVISLIKSVDRREKVIAKLGNQKIDFEFLDAVDGTAGEHPYLKKYNEEQFLLNCRRKAVAGELGCYVSHLLAWEKCLALNEPIIVLEDDFDITSNFEEGIKFLDEVVNKVSFIRLEPLESSFVLPSYKRGRFTLVKQLKVSMCTTGYMITPRGAKALLMNGMEICSPIDRYLRHTLIHKQLIHALVPHIVYSSLIGSIIGQEFRNFRQSGLVLQIKRFIRRWLLATGGLTINIFNTLTNF